MSLGRAGLRSGLVGLCALGLACGPGVEPGTTGAGASSSGGVTDDGESESVSTTVPAGSSGSDAGEASTTATPDDDGYEDDDGGTGCTFTCPDPPPPTPPPGDGDWCGLSCPEGEKCMPWANDGGMAWTAFRCTPLADDPDVAGEPCMVEGSQWSGIDSCDASSICWQVDPRTNAGVCHATCGVVDGVVQGCEEPFGCVLQELGVPLCEQGCEPLAPACPEGQLCAFASSDLVCQPVFGELAAAGQPCGPALACESGTLCSFEPALDCGNGPGEGCCATPCDLNDPSACTGPETCLPWFTLRPPPELAYLGVCAGA